MRFAFLFPRFKILSGAERLILKLASALIDHGHQIHIYCHQFDDTCRPILPENANLIVSGLKLDYFGNRYANAAFDYFRSGRLAQLTGTNGKAPDGLDAICCFGPALAALTNLRKISSAPIFYFCYEPPRFLYTDRQAIGNRLGAAAILAPAFAIYKQIDRSRVKSADAILCNSQFGEKQIEAIYGRNATVITHGLDPFRKSDQRTNIRERFRIRPEDLLVITVNYLHPRKRIDLFIKSVQDARKTNTSIKGLIVGDGPEMEALKCLTGAEINFAGFIPESQLADFYQAADVYLHTGRLETFGLSVIEASGNHLPVVSVNEGGPKETVIDGQTGILTDASVSSLSAAISKLSTNENLRLQFAESGFDFVRKKFQWSKGAEDFLQAVKLRKTDPS